GQVEAEPAVLGRDRHPEEAELPHLRDERLRELVRVLVLGRDGIDLLLDPLADGRDDPLVHAATGRRRSPLTSSSSSRRRIASSSARTSSSPQARSAFSRNFARTSSALSGFSGP